MDVISKLQLRFLKLILGVKVTTPTCMVLGEVGRYPIEIEAKCRMLGFWYGLCSTSHSESPKISNLMFQLCSKLLLLLLSWCLMSSDVIWHIRDKLWPMPKHGSIRKVYACLAVTCHLHFWQNDRDFLRATVVTRGWNGYRNKSQHRKSTLEKKILPPFQQGFEPATFQSRVRRSNHWAIPAPQVLSCTMQAIISSHGLWKCIRY